MKSCYLRYVFVDVVGYSSESLEDQFEIVRALQEIVWKATKFFNLPGEFQPEVTFLPTGDGMCIAINRDVVDIHLQVALKIVEFLSERTEKPRFQVRIGINENEDVSYEDINKRENFAGRGINLAQRVMSFAEGMQIFVGSNVYEKLGGRRAYKDRFRQFLAEFKGEKLMIYQYADPGNPRLKSFLSNYQKSCVVKS